MSEFSTRLAMYKHTASQPVQLSARAYRGRLCSRRGEEPG